MDWSTKSIQSIPYLMFDETGMETCGFLLGDRQRGIIEIWPTPSLRPDGVSYRIGRQAWGDARAKAEEAEMTLLGSIHSHPNGPPGPSEKDLALARHLRSDDHVRATWHPRSSTLTLYGPDGIISQQTIPRPWWHRLLAPILFV